MRNALGTLATPAGKAGRLFVKAVLTGPYTLARFTAVEETMDAASQIIDARANAYAKAIGEEIEALAAAGAELIQIDEPAILDSPRDWSLLQDLIDVLVNIAIRRGRRGGTVDPFMSVYFRDCTPFYDELLEMPVDAVGLDFASSPGLAGRVAEAGSPKPLVLGLVNGLKADLENPAELAGWSSGFCRRLRVGGAFEYFVWVGDLFAEAGFCEIGVVGEDAGGIGGLTGGGRLSPGGRSGRRGIVRLAAE